MDDKTRKRIDKVIAEAVELADGGMDEFAAARESLTAQVTDVLRELAIAALVDTIRRRRRSNVLDIERSSEVRPRRRGDQSWKTPEHFAAQEEITRRHHEEMYRIIDNYARDLKVQWTAELLGADFALADGTRVTWGDATVDQHQERAALFQRNAVANAEGAARHLQAIEQLQSSGCATLADLVERAA